MEDREVLKSGGDHVSEKVAFIAAMTTWPLRYLPIESKISSAISENAARFEPEICHRGNERDQAFAPENCPGR